MSLRVIRNSTTLLVAQCISVRTESFILQKKSLRVHEIYLFYRTTCHVTMIAFTVVSYLCLIMKF